MTYEEEVEKAKIMKCQWLHKNRKELITYTISVNCDDCPKRFLCHTITAKRFKVSEEETAWREFEVFAEDKLSAQEKFYDYYSDEEAGITQIGENSETTDVLIEEWNED